MRFYGTTPDFFCFFGPSPSAVLCLQAGTGLAAAASHALRGRRGPVFMKRSSPRAELPAATMRRRSRVTTRAIVFAACASLGCAPVYTQEPTTLDMDMAHCGKKFRIATHIAPPYIMVDVDKCVAQKCGPEAFGDNGGVVYKLMMEHILPQLRTYCKVVSPRICRPYLSLRIVRTPLLPVHWRRNSNRRPDTPSSSTLNGTFLASLQTLPRRKRRSKWFVKDSFTAPSCGLLQNHLR